MESYEFGDTFLPFFHVFSDSFKITINEYENMKYEERI